MRGARIEPRPGWIALADRVDVMVRRLVEVFAAIVLGCPSHGPGRLDHAGIRILMLLSRHPLLKMFPDLSACRIAYMNVRA